MLRVAGRHVELGQDLLHPAELGLEHGLPLRVGEPLRAERDPRGHVLHGLERRRVAGHPVHVEEARHDLVQGVVGRPDALARLHAVDELLGEGGQVARAHAPRRQRPLDLAQLGDEPEGAGLQPLVAGRLVHQRAGGQVVAEAVAAQLDARRLPAAVGLRRGRQARVEAERVEEPVRVEAQQVGEAPLLRVAERPVEDPHVAKGKRLGRRRHRPAAPPPPATPGPPRERPPRVACRIIRQLRRQPGVLEGAEPPRLGGSWHRPGLLSSQVPERRMTGVRRIALPMAQDDEARLKNSRFKT